MAPRFFWIAVRQVSYFSSGCVVARGLEAQEAASYQLEQQWRRTITKPQKQTEKQHIAPATGIALNTEKACKSS
jgi:hypothetical protein